MIINPGKFLTDGNFSELDYLEPKDAFFSEDRVPIVALLDFIGNSSFALNTIK